MSKLAVCHFRFASHEAVIDSTTSQVTTGSSQRPYLLHTVDVLRHSDLFYPTDSRTSTKQATAQRMKIA